MWPRKRIVVLTAYEAAYPAANHTTDIAFMYCVSPSAQTSSSATSAKVKAMGKQRIRLKETVHEIDRSNGLKVGQKEKLTHKCHLEGDREIDTTDVWEEVVLEGCHALEEVVEVKDVTASRGTRV